MKRKALAMILALCMVLSMLPMNVFAAQPQAVPFRANDAVGFDALPEAPAELNGEYSITKSKTGPGDIASNPGSSANAGDEVLLMANPDPGYMALVDDHGLELEFFYIGFDTYVFTMPARDVTLDFYFEAIEGESYSVNVDAPADCNWSLMDGITSAKEGESVYLFIQEDEYFRLDPETDVTANCEYFFYLGTFDDEGTQHVYELFMPAHDVTIDINTTAEKVAHYIDVQINNPGWGSVSLVFGEYAREGDIVTFHAEPHYGYKLVSMWTDSGAKINSIGGNLYSFIMPDAEETIYVSFDKNINPVSVVVETGLGGTATLDVTEAQETDMVTLTCTPEVGYRIARISGVDKLHDLGGGQYRFTMPGKAVTIQVLFLRNENPFLDVNETQFFYNSVLWAVEENITSGMSPDAFGPFAVCNRAQVVTFLWRYAGSPEPTATEHPFLDVPAGSWFEQPVLWALENGITTGISATEFGANLPCNRAQAVTFLWRMLKQPVPSLTEHPFSDVQAGSWYETPVLWALSNGITTGATTSTFNPNGECQRAQVVTFLHRTAQLPVYYEITAAFDAAMGSVTLSHNEAQAGETVTVTVLPNEGYILESIRTESGTELTQTGDNEYTFVMGEEAETVIVDFAEIEKPSTPKTYELVLKSSGHGTVAHVDATTAAPGESIFFHAVPEEGYYLERVGIFNPDNSIDVSLIRLYEHEDNLYELVMINHDIIMTCYFSPIPG